MADEVEVESTPEVEVAPVVTPAPVATGLVDAPAVPTAEDVDKATRVIRDVDAELALLPPDHPKRKGLVDDKVRAFNTVLAARNQPATPAGPTFAQQISAEQEVAEINKRMKNRPQGHAADARDIERLIQLSAITAHDRLTADAEARTFGVDDVRKAAPDRWGDAEFTRYELATRRAGATLPESAALLYELREPAPLDDGRTLTEFLQEHWKDDFEAKLKVADKVWAKLTPDDREDLHPYLRSPRVLALLVQVGARLK